MSLANELAPHIPYLRRFARALVGSQAAGDNYVAAVLETIVTDRSVFPTDMPAKIGLYRTFVALWQSFDINLDGQEALTAWEARARGNLTAITPRARQAFLLTAVEGFTRQETADILGVGIGECGELIQKAHEDIAAQVATDIMIIEDEPLIAMDIETMVEELGHRVTGIARTHKEAIELFQNKTPSIVLADIQLADGSSGLEAVNEILSEKVVPVIFITAFPERLLTGERPEPAFLVTKPFQPDMVSALISQILFFDEMPAGKACSALEPIAS